MTPKATLFSLVAGFALISALGALAELLIPPASTWDARSEWLTTLLFVIVGVLVKTRSGHREVLQLVALLLFAIAAWRLTRVVFVIAGGALGSRFETVFDLELVFALIFGFVMFSVFITLARRGAQN